MSELLNNQVAESSWRHRDIDHWGYVLLPMILSLLPIFILFFDLDPEGLERPLINARQAWLGKTDPLTQSFAEASELRYWLGKQRKRFMEKIEALIIQNRLPFSKICQLAAKNHFLEKELPAQVWVFSLDAEGKKANAVQGIGLCQRKKFLLNRLAALMNGNGAKESSELHGSKWEKRIKTLFGHMVFSDLFTSAYRGKYFPVILETKAGLLGWDWILDRSKSQVENARVGLILWFSPQPHDVVALCKRLCLKYWNVIRGKQVGFPAFIPLATFKPTLADIHPALSRKKLLGHIQKFCRGTCKVEGSKSYDKLGKVSLPSSWIGRPIPLGDMWGRLCVLAASSNHMGLVITEHPVLQKPFHQHLLPLLVWLWVAIWGILLLRRWLVQRFPVPGVRWGMIFWLLLLGGIPITMCVGVWSNMFSDLRENLIDSAREDLTQLLSSIESGTVQFRSRFLTNSREMMSLPGLGQQLLYAQLEDRGIDQVIERMWKSYEKHNIKPTAIIIYGLNNFSKYRIDPNTFDESQMSNFLLLQVLSKKLLEDMSSKEFTQYIERHQKGGHDKSSMVLLTKDLTLKSSLSGILRRFHTAELYKIGNRHCMHFYDLLKVLHPLTNRLEAGFIIMALWDQDPAYRRYLQSTVSRANLFEQKNFANSLEVAAFKIGPEGPTYIAGIDKARTMSRLAALPMGKMTTHVDYNTLSAIMPSTKLPGYILTAKMSLAEVNKRVMIEGFFTASSLVVLFILLVTGGCILTKWWSRPIQTMSKALERISAGELSIRVAMPRDDELGRASRSLDTMTTWLEERERMSHFVAPQVLDVIAGGNIFVAGAGIERRVAILVSDIRSFTTLSEIHPPEATFAMLNSHLDIMTRQIKRHHGEIDRFVGDAIWAVFYEGFDDSPAELAVRAASDMKRSHDLLNEQRMIQGKFTYQIGIGIDVGPIIAGVIGDAESRLDFSVVGETLQRAEELESLSRHGKFTRIVISETGKLELFDSRSWHSLPEGNNCWELEGLR